MTYACDPGHDRVLRTADRRATFAVHGKAHVQNHDDIDFDNLFRAIRPHRHCLHRGADDLSHRERLRKGPPRLAGLSHRIERTAQDRDARAGMARRSAATCGTHVPLKIALRTYRGTDVVKTLPIEIPANASGSLSMLVSDGARLGQTEQREAWPAATANRRPSDKSLNKARRNNTLYVKLLGSDAGAVVNGERLSSLPPSVLAVLEADRNGGNLQPAADRDARRMGTADRAGGQRGAYDFRSPSPELHELSAGTYHTAPRHGRAASSVGRLVVHRSGADAWHRCFTRRRPKFFQADDAGRLPQGRRREPLIDTQRAAGARPRHRARLRNRRAVSLVDRRAPDGSLFVGTGNEGKVFRIDAEGRGSLFFDSAELEVARAGARAQRRALRRHLTRRPNLQGRSQRHGHVFFDPDDKYIWSLAVDAKGNLFAGTGEKGHGLQDRARRQRREFYKTNATHATALAFDKAGNLLVGTGAGHACCASMPTARGSSCSIRRSRRSARSASTRRACCTWPR